MKAGRRFSIPLVLAALWAVLIGINIFPPTGWHVEFVRELAGGFTDFPPFPRFLAAMLSHLALLAAGAAFAFAVTMGGWRAARFLGVSPAGSAVEAICLSALAGWFLLAMLFYGLALTGLFYPFLLLISAGAFPVMGLMGSGRRTFRFGGISPPSTSSVKLVVLLAAPVLIALPVVFLPPLYIDFYQYHMAAPQHFLRLHRFVIEGVGIGFQVFLSSDLLNSLALIMGRDSLAVFISLVPFVSGLALGAVWIGREGGERRGALEVGLAMATGGTIWVLNSGKNDLAAGGMCLAAFLAFAGGRRIMAATLWGFACGTKINCLPFAALAYAWHEAHRIGAKRTAWRPDLKWILLIGIPAAPWLVKSFILKGDPIWPILSTVLPWGLWDADFERARLMVMGRDREAWDLLAAAMANVLESFPAAIAALPLLIYFMPNLSKGMRSMTLMSLVAFGVFIVFVWPEPRYAIPVGLFWCFLAAAALDMLMEILSSRSSKAVMAGVCVLAWLSVLGTARVALRGIDSDSARLFLGRLTQDEYLSRRLTTTWEAERTLRNTDGLRSVLLVNVDAAYRWPGRPVVEEWYGRKPTWVLTHESTDRHRMYIRLKQRNIRHMALNFITEFHVGSEKVFYSSHKWTKRQIELIIDFMKNNTRIVSRPERVDSPNGGYYIYEIFRQVSRPESYVYYLPGTQELVSRIHEPHFQKKNPAMSRKLAAALARDYPEVGIFRMLSARFAFLMNDWAGAYRDFDFVAKRGMVGDISGVLYAESALYLGRYGAAIAIVDRTKPLFPEDALLFEDIRAMALLKLAWAYAGDFKRTNEALMMAREAIQASPGNPAAHVGFAMVLNKLGRRGEARAVLLRAREAWPEDEEVLEYCKKYLKDKAEGGN